MNMSNKHSNILLNTSIKNNYDWIGIGQSIKNNVIKFVKVSGSAFFVFIICLVKGKTTRKIIK